jgi:hypothetical protein
MSSGMNRRLPKLHGSSDKTKEREGGSPKHTFTHCVVCNYESKVDFDVCPKCKSEGMAVLVLKKA